MEKVLERFTPVIVNKKYKYYVGYVDAYLWTIWSGSQYIVVIGNNRKTDYITCKYKDVIEISNKEFLFVEDKLCKIK